MTLLSFTWQAFLLAAAGTAGAYALVVGALAAGQRRILFRPDPGPPELARAGVPGLAALQVPTADGLNLLAWHLAPQGATPTVLLLHGNAGHIGHRSDRLRAFAALGWGVLLLEYRGYGGNPGYPSEAGLRQDAAAALAALHGRGVAPERILVWGESLGSGLATWLAAREAVGAVVLETPYTSIADIAKRRYPYVPVDRLLRDRFESLPHMPAIRAPVIVLVAGRDRVVPPEMGKAIHAAGPPGTELWEAPAGSHTDLLEHGAMQAVADFAARRMAPAPGLHPAARIATTAL